jgi:threonine/homoserine/homoserine lactone efflux protein
MAVLLTPGPTNTLLAAAGLNKGIRGAMPLVGLELAGYIVAISIWGVFFIPLQAKISWLSIMFRVTSSVYLLYIAVDVWRTASLNSVSIKRNVGSKRLFFATILNPKGFLFSTAILPKGTFENISLYLLAMAVFSCVLIPIGIIWVGIGATVRSETLKDGKEIFFRRVTSLILVFFSIFILYKSFT